MARTAHHLRLLRVQLLQVSAQLKVVMMVSMMVPIAPTSTVVVIRGVDGLLGVMLDAVGASVGGCSDPFLAAVGVSGKNSRDEGRTEPGTTAPFFIGASPRLSYFELALLFLLL